MKEKYETVTPYATYSPWNTDTEFQEVYSAIKGHTLVDEYRCYELWKLVEQSAKLDRGSLLEVGVWKGGTGALIAKQAERSIFERSRVYLCDTFTGLVKAGPEDSVYKGDEYSVPSDEAEALLLQMRLFNAEIKKGIFPDQTGKSLEDEVFRFAHIDVDTYHSAKDITEWIWPRMVPGGIIVYDDYGFEDCNGVTKHVNEQEGLEDRLLIHNLNGHAIVVKL